MQSTKTRCAEVAGEVASAAELAVPEMVDTREAVRKCQFAAVTDLAIPAGGLLFYVPVVFSCVDDLNRRLREKLRSASGVSY